MNDPLNESLAKQLLELKRRISTFNKKGDLNGLFSYHILSAPSDFDLNWSVTCNDEDWIEKAFDRNNLYHVAALGYSLHLAREGHSNCHSTFLKSLHDIKKRDHFNAGHTTFPYQPVTFLGLALGVGRLPNPTEKRQLTEWLCSVLAERRKRGELSGCHEIFYNYIETRLTNKDFTLLDMRSLVQLEEFSFVQWCYSRGFFKIARPENNVAEIQGKILQLLVESDVNSIVPEYAALVWSAAHDSILGGINKLTKSPSHLVNILRLFPAAMKRWRYDDGSIQKPIRWPVISEREVQDITWLMLRPYFNDIVDEESLPKFGHSSYKPDFAIPSLRVLLEVKYVRNRGEFKKVEKEIMEDSVGYLVNSDDYDQIVVFIYDHSSSVQEHDTTRRDLMKISGIEDVVIVSRPSQLPV